MDKASQQARIKFSVEPTQEPHLLRALKSARMPATQSALRHIAVRNAMQTQTAPALPQYSPKVTEAVSGRRLASDALVRALADAINEWHTRLPPDLGVGVLALVQDGITIEVQSMVACAPDLIRISGICQGQAYRMLAPVSDFQFVCVPQARDLGSSATKLRLEVSAEH